MSREYSTTIGSGSLPHNRDHPIYNGSNFASQFPGVGSRDQLRTRTGEGAVVLNFEDTSLNKSFDNLQMDISTAAVPLPSIVYQRVMALHNNGPDILYVGTSIVTTSDGFPLATGEKMSIDLQGNDQVRLYVISGGDSDLRILRFG